MTRLEVLAILKSMIEASLPSVHWSEAIQKSAELLDQYGTTSPSIPSAPAAGAPAPAAGGSQDHGTHTLTLEGIEDHGNRVRVTASGFQGAKFFTAFGDEAAAFRLMQIPTVFSATIKSKPNPNKPGANYWNISDAKVNASVTKTAQAVHPAAPDDVIPF